MRQLSEDLRVMLPGVRVLFGFLLILPFTSSLLASSAWDRAFYFIAFLSAAGASAFLIAPGIHQRLHARDVRPERVLQNGNRLAVAGTVLLILSVVSVLLLITKLLYGTRWAIGVAVTGAFLFSWLWYGMLITSVYGDE